MQRHRAGPYAPVRAGAHLQQRPSEIQRLRPGHRCSHVGHEWPVFSMSGPVNEPFSVKVLLHCCSSSLETSCYASGLEAFVSMGFFQSCDTLKPEGL